MSWEQATQGIHICAEARVAAMQLQGHGIGWAARTLEKAADRIDKLERIAEPLVSRENQRLVQLLLDHGVLETTGDMPEFTMFEWTEEHEWLVAACGENGIGPK